MIERVSTDQGLASNLKSAVASDFSGGMLRSLSPARLSSNQYSLLINGRSRYSEIKTIKRPLELTNRVAAGKYQALFAADPFLLVFIDGRAYISNLEEDVKSDKAFFTQVFDFQQMDRFVDRIYVEKIPASLRNFSRAVVNPFNIAGGVQLGSSIAGSPQCILCQDGINQPRIIFENGQSRVTQSIEEWKRNDDNAELDNREYVPIGKQMCYSADGILYIISPDGKEIYRSVAGRPLDFVIAVDQDGQKLSRVNIDVEASRLSHRVGYDPITAIQRVNTKIFDASISGGIFVSTGRHSWIVATNYSNTLFGEPTFINLALFPTGPLNNFSTVDTSGDTVFVDSAGLRSFNAIGTLTSEGENSPFSKDIDELLADIEQVDPVAISSGNYTYFAVNTKFGYGIIVFDELREVFNSLDLYSNVTASIKQFAEVKVKGRRKLFFITTDNRLYEMYTDSVTETCQLYPQEWDVNDKDQEQIPKRVYVEFSNVREDGVATIQTFVDRKGTSVKSRSVSRSATSESTPSQIPYTNQEGSTTENLLFKTEDSIRGRKLGILVTFNFDAELSSLQVVSELQKTKMPHKQAAKNY